jgi:hypothetical protein
LGYTVFGTARVPAGNSPDGVTMLPSDVTFDASKSVVPDAAGEVRTPLDLSIGTVGEGAEFS